MRIIATPPRAQVALVFTMIAGLAGAPAEAAKPTPTPTPTPTPASLYHTIDLVAPAGTTFRSDLANRRWLLSVAVVPTRSGCGGSGVERRAVLSLGSPRAGSAAARGQMPP